MLISRATIAAVAALLFGCATPQQLMDTGHRSAHALTKPPAIAAACLARNAEADRDWFTVTVRPLDTLDRLEVILRNSPEIALALAHVEPAASGSRATIWLRKEWFYRRDELVAAMIAGC